MVIGSTILFVFVCWEWSPVPEGRERNENMFLLASIVIFVCWYVSTAYNSSLANGDDIVGSIRRINTNGRGKFFDKKLYSGRVGSIGSSQRRNHTTTKKQADLFDFNSHIPEDVLLHIGSSKSGNVSLVNYKPISRYSRRNASYVPNLLQPLFRPLKANSLAALNNSSCILKDPANKLSKSNHHLIIIFIDSKFFSLYHNWHLYFIDICGQARINQLELVCMDEIVINSLSKLGLKCSPHSFVIHSSGYAGMNSIKRPASIWIRRMEVIVFYLQHGMDLLLTDTDAIWRSDPYVDLNRYYSSADVIASKGSFPGTLFNQWGATICMGYIFFKASPFTIKFMEDAMEDMRRKEKIMELIQEEIVTRRRTIPNAVWDDSQSRLSETAFFNVVSKRISENIRRRKKYRTKLSSAQSKERAGSSPRSRQLTIQISEENDESSQDIPDIPGPNFADNLGSDEEMEVLQPLQNHSNSTEKLELTPPMEIFASKYSSKEVADATEWIRSNELSVYNPALERFHQLLLSRQLDELLPTNKSASDERKNMDILHFLYDARDLEGNKPDDQYAVNTVLYTLGVNWQRHPMAVVEGNYLKPDIGTVLKSESKDRTISSSVPSFRGSMQHPGRYVNGSILLLPHYAYLRNCTGVSYNRKTRSIGYRNAKIAVAQPEAVVAHCLLSPGDAKKKYMSLRTYKLWHEDAPRITMATSSYNMSSEDFRASMRSKRRGYNSTRGQDWGQLAPRNSTEHAQKINFYRKKIIEKRKQMLRQREMKEKTMMEQ